MTRSEKHQQKPPGRVRGAVLGSSVSPDRGLTVEQNMLGSTDFFPSIDGRYSERATRKPCQYSYSHFHPRRAQDSGALSSGVTASPAAGLGYDSYNPGLTQPPVKNGALGQGDGKLELELELVNQAIEAMRGEVELEQRRYQEFLETARGHSAGPSALAPCSPATSMDEDDTFSLALTYKSGSLLSLDAAYQPTPLAVPAEPGHKYSLAPSDMGKGRAEEGAGALEYVPKSVGQLSCSGRPMSGGKYVVDSSKPLTDLEYDPLFNYSVPHLGRASASYERATKRPRGSRDAEPYTPALKKPCDPFRGCEARFSHSEDDVARPPKGDVSDPKAGAASQSTRHSVRGQDRLPSHGLSRCWGSQGE